MKYLLLTIASFCLFVACSKSSSSQDSDPIQKTLSGKWIYTEQWESTGGPGQWVVVTPPNQYISFNADSTFSTNTQMFQGVTGYQLVDSNKVKLIKPSFAPTGYIIFQYGIDTVVGKLTISPLAPYVCIEGCASRFKKEQLPTK